MSDHLNLIYQSHLDDERLTGCWNHSILHNDIKNVSKMIRWSHRPYFFAHRGPDNMPFSRKIWADSLTIPIVDYDPTFNKTFADITDARARELIDQSVALNRPLVVNYGGGIDSVVMATALAKVSTEQERRHNIIITTTKAGYWEAPNFWNKYLIPMFPNIANWDQHQARVLAADPGSYLITNGEPADQLIITIQNSTGVVFNEPEWLTVPWKNTAKLKQFLMRFLKDQDLVDWLSAKVGENIDGMDVPIESCYAYLKWISMNYFFTGATEAEYAQSYYKIYTDLDLWNRTWCRWFTHPDYQRWAMANINNYDLLMGPKKDTWKWVYKKYIFDFCQDPYYFNYKTKVNSGGRQGIRGPGAEPKYWVAMVNKSEFLYWGDLDRLQVVIPRYVNHNLY
jgi:hypothetical protein